MQNKKIFLALKWITTILQKHQIPFQISGGFAAHIYGSTRPVNDIDIDLPEEKFDLILPEIKPYIIFGPAQYKDARWDLKLVTLNYNGQEIDLGGAFKAKIFNDELQSWTNFSANLQKTQSHNLNGLIIPVIAPQDLINYKKLLSGNHQKKDIKAIENYLKSNLD